MRAENAEGKTAFEEDGRPAEMGFAQETIFTCDFDDRADGRFYRFVIPVKKAVDRVEPEIFAEYKDKLIIDSIAVK